MSPRLGMTIGLSLLVGTGLMACSDSSSLSPTAPSSLPSTKVQLLTITCTANVTRQSLDGLPVVVTFDAPVASGGLAPITTGCSPGSDSALPVGTTAVSCTATDSLQQAAACTFLIAVAAPPNWFLAFGDSLTAGVVSSPVGVLRLTTSQSYPFKLQSKLAQHFAMQSVDVVNVGVAGERAEDATGRFRNELARVQPEVVLLMEGTNDLIHSQASGPSLAIAGLDAMIREAKSQGVEVLLATIPPQRPVPSRAAVAAIIPAFNAEIGVLAQRHNVTLVDVFTALNEGVCPPAGLRLIQDSLACIGDDHLHPTEAGYDLVAEAFFDAIVAAFDVSLPPFTSRRSDLPPYR